MTVASNAVSHEPPQINQKMWRGAAQMAVAIHALSEDGFIVIGMEYTGAAAPTIQVQHADQCDRLIKNGDATYYYEGGNGAGRNRKGQFHAHGVRVIWIERGN